MFCTVNDRRKSGWGWASRVNKFTFHEEILGLFSNNVRLECPLSLILLGSCSLTKKKMRVQFLKTCNLPRKSRSATRNIRKVDPNGLNIFLCVYRTLNPKATNDHRQLQRELCLLYSSLLFLPDLNITVFFLSIHEFFMLS